MFSGSATYVPPLRQKPSISSLDTQSSASSSSAPTRPRRTRLTVRTQPLPLPQELERSYGELDAYPLRRCSVLCKATGGGRWEPKPCIVLDGYRLPVPGGKAPSRSRWSANRKRSASASQIPSSATATSSTASARSPSPRISQEVSTTPLPFNHPKVPCLFAIVAYRYYCILLATVTISILALPIPALHTPSPIMGFAMLFSLTFCCSIL